MELKINDRTNFGWFFGTHKGATLFAVKGLENLEPYRNSLKYFSKIPDKDEKGFFNNWHFYNPTEKKSFCDFNKKSNAFAKYKEHTYQMIKALRENNLKLCIEQAGRALHYLQDMTQPMHIQKGFIFNKILCLKKHMAFEKYVKENQDDYFSAYKGRGFNNKTFTKIFQENVRKSLELKLPFDEKIPKEEDLKTSSPWDEVGMKGVEQAIHSSREFAYKLNKMMELRKSRTN